MLTFEKVLKVFQAYLDDDPLYEVVQTSHGYTLMAQLIVLTAKVDYNNLLSVHEYSSYFLSDKTAVCPFHLSISHFIIPKIISLYKCIPQNPCAFPIPLSLFTIFVDFQHKKTAFFSWYFLSFLLLFQGR